MQRWTRPLLAEPDRVILSHVWTTSTCYKPLEIERSVQAPTTNLPSNDPWRDEESPQTPETPRLVLECEKPRSAKGNAGKQREKDSRSRWRKKPDATTKTETHLHPGPTRTRKPSTPDLDTQAWQTGKTPARHPHHA